MIIVVYSLVVICKYSVYFGQFTDLVLMMHFRRSSQQLGIWSLLPNYDHKVLHLYMWFLKKMLEHRICSFMLNPK